MNCNNNLIVNGDFEQLLSEPTGPLGAKVGGVLQNWTQSSIDIHGRYQWTSGVDINRFVDLNGFAPGYIEQSFPTTSGRHYLVTFKLQGNWAENKSVPRDGYVTAASQQMNFSVPTSSYSLSSWPPATEQEIGWINKQFIFTAVSTGTILKFASTTSNSFCGPIIDDVCVIETTLAPISNTECSSCDNVCEDYTKFNNVTQIGENYLLNQLEDNLKTFLDWGLLNIGGFVNVNMPTSGLYGGTFHDLKTSDHPGYVKGQVWQSAKKDWVWETGVSYNGSQPNTISNISINNVSYPAPTGSGSIGFYINYPLGQVVFNKPLPPTTSVKLQHSYRWCQTYKSSSDPYWVELQGLTYDPSPALEQRDKGSYNLSSNHRIQMPCIVIEPIARSFSQPWQLGAFNFAVNQDILLHIFAENSHDKNHLTDIIRLQKQKTIWLYDINKVVNSGVNPLDYRGSINSNGKNYRDLVTNPSYRWHKCYFKEINISEMESQNKSLYWCTIRLTTEVII